MTKHSTDEQQRRRRGAASELRERAGDPLSEASRLDGYPPVWLTLDQASAIAAQIGVSTSALAEAIEGLSKQ